MGEKRLNLVNVTYSDERASTLPSYLNRNELILFTAHVHELRQYGVLDMGFHGIYTEEAHHALFSDTPFMDTMQWIHENRDLAVQLWGTEAQVIAWPKDKYHDF